MNYNLYLIIALFLLTLVHLALYLKNILGSLGLKYFSTSNEIDNIKYTPKKNILRNILSTINLLFPFIIFISYNGFNQTNTTVDLIIISILILITAYLIYFHQYKIWSKDFKDDENSIHPHIVLKNEISRNKDLLENDIKSAKDKIDLTTINAHKLITKIEKQNLTVSEKLLEKQNQNFESYFKSVKQYEDTMNLLEINNFYKVKKNLTPVYLCILSYKLQLLNLIDIENKQTYFVKALAKHFKINKIDETQFSRTFKRFDNTDGLKTIPDSNSKFFESLRYLGEPHKT